MNNIFAVAFHFLGPQGTLPAEGRLRPFIRTVLIDSSWLVNIFKDKTSYGFKEICLGSWICSLVHRRYHTGAQIPMERENRTLFPLLAQALSRPQNFCWASSRLESPAASPSFAFTPSSDPDATRETYGPFPQLFEGGFTPLGCCWRW